MNKKILLLIIIGLISACAPPANKKTPVVLIEDALIKNVFTQQGHTNATFVLYNSQIPELAGYNYPRSTIQFVPASTFKIPTSIISLMDGIITNIDEVFFHYQGQEVYSDVWTNSMSLKQAFKSSNVPAYQLLASLIGLTNYQQYLTKFQYGNQEIGTNVTKFWLDGPLKISALEQVNFINKVLTNEFNLSSNIITQLKEISYQETLKNNWKLYGKTGWANNIGWFVGWIEKDNHYYSFALNMDITNANSLPLREELTKNVLDKIIEEIK